MEYLNGASTDSGEVERARGRVLGQLIGDGGLTTGSHIYLFSKTTDLIDSHIAAVSAGFDNMNFRHYTGTRDVLRVRSCGERGNAGNNLLRWLRDLGLKSATGGANSHQKYIPERYKSAPVDVLRALVAGLWDTDGTVGAVPKGKSWSFNSSYRTVSLQLAQDVEFVLRRLGLTCHRTRNVDSSGNVSYIVNVSDAVAFAAQFDRLLHHTRKAERIAIILGTAPSVTRARGGGSHFPIPVLKAAVKEAQFPLRWLGKVGIERTILNTNAYAGRDVLSRVAKATGSERIATFTNVRWVRVTAQEQAGATPSYHITVDGIHSFIANDLVVKSSVLVSK
ncbi:LAGLIDADG family homing endonuclease [Salinibacterium sp. ZJ454]|uniref:LAGLIDADG family homing endonuclease n=1 Tax=Salinibacterium sp. ZJ454 TaxID=2708339 RepID=UPI0014205754|nr:LAGLIDADG family homing endonuclease [Salinibacterium sp. ZJ454]